MVSMKHGVSCFFFQKSHGTGTVLKCAFMLVLLKDIICAIFYEELVFSPYMIH